MDGEAARIRSQAGGLRARPCCLDALTIRPDLPRIVTGSSRGVVSPLVVRCLRALERRPQVMVASDPQHAPLGRVARGGVYQHGVQLLLDAGSEVIETSPVDPFHP